jgi:RNA polymerase sigma factor (sigma-70 family)
MISPLPWSGPSTIFEPAVRLHSQGDEVLPSTLLTATQQDQRIVDTISRERNRLRSFIRKRVANADEADDILQDVFCELVEAARLMKPVEQVNAWLFRVARNRITDLFRKRRPEVSTDRPVLSADAEELRFEDLLPSPDGGPEAAYAREVLLDEIDAALDELPEEQRDVFVAHELEGKSFKELAAETGLSVNTLLARKRYAVLRLRRRLWAIYDEFRSP